MKELDTIGIKLCDEQAELFEKSLEYKNVGSLLFIKRFVYSETAKKFDDLSIINQIFSPDEELKKINSNKQPKKIGKRFDKNTLFWIGYIYRYWAYTYEESSINIYKMILPTKLAKFYEIYHTLDPKKAIERIIEAEAIETKKEISYGVNIYRKIINNYN